MSDDQTFMWEYEDSLQVNSC